MKRTMQTAAARRPRETVSAPAAAGVRARSLSWLGHPAVQAVFVVLLGLAAYSNTFQAPFVFDDRSSIVGNGVIKDLGSFLGGAGYAHNPRRFVGYLTMALNYRFGGLDVAGYHAVNLAIHITTALLLYWLARLVLRTPFFQDQFQVSSFKFQVPGSSTSNFKLETLNLLPLFTALLFVAHPVQTQAVTYIVQRLASLAAMFYILTLALYIKGRLQVSSLKFKDEPETRNLKLETLFFFSLSLISALLALRSKENAFTLPLALLLVEFSFFRGGAAKRLAAIIPAAAMIAAALYGAMRADKPLGVWLSDVTEKLTAADNISRGEYLINQFRVIVTYVRLLFLPVNQNLDYDYPFYDSLFDPPVFFSFLFLAALLGLAGRLYYRSGECKIKNEKYKMQNENDPSNFSFFTPGTSRLVAFGIFWFFITLLVESSLIPIADLIFEHRLYLPAAGPFLAVSALACRAGSRYSQRTVVAAMAVVVLVLAAATWKRNQVWGSEISLWSDVAEKSPGAVRGHFNLGVALLKAGRLDEALVELEAALAASKDFEYDSAYLSKLNDCIGVVYNKKGMVDQAFERLQAAVSIDGGNADARSNLALVMGKKGLIDQSIEQALIAIRLKPDLAEAYKNLGTAYLVKGMLPEAASQLEKAVALDPALAEAHNSLGIVYLRRGETGKAVMKFQEAVRLKPDQADFRDNLAMVLDQGEKR